MSLFSRLKGLLQIHRLERDLDEELRSHIELLILKEQSAQKQKRLRRIGGAISYENKHTTFLKIVK